MVIPDNFDVMLALERFQRHISKVGCWVWTGCVHPVTGYGQFRFNGKTSRAHRIAWTLFRGSIANGLNVCHTCDNRACVNPDHLFLGTQRDNLQDMSKKGRGGKSGRKGENHPGSKLSSDDVMRILKDERRHEEIAMQYGVTTSVISHIKTGRSWTHITNLTRTR